MKKTIARLILAGWVVIIVGGIGIIFIQAPLLTLLLSGGFFGVIALIWALDQLGL